MTKLDLHTPTPHLRTLVRRKPGSEQGKVCPTIGKKTEKIDAGSMYMKNVNLLLLA